MPSANYMLIRQAILDKRNISANYKGHKRHMSPHAIGTAKNGNEQALFYQYAGSSSSGLMPPGHPSNWRCIPIDGLQDVTLLDGPWESAGNHSTDQTCVHNIDLEVDY